MEVTSSARARPGPFTIGVAAVSLGVLVYMAAKKYVAGRHLSASGVTSPPPSVPASTVGRSSHGRTASLTPDATEALYSSYLRHHMREVGVETEWRDEQLGFLFRYPTSVLRLAKEERASQLLQLLLVPCRAGGQPFSIAICIEETAATELGATATAEAFCQASRSRLQGCAHIVSQDTIKIAGNSFPQLTYAFQTVSDATVKLATAVFAVHDKLCFTFQYTAPKSQKSSSLSLMHDIVKKAIFYEPAATPSYLVCSEPRMGFGIRIPLGFELLNESDDGRDLDDGSDSYAVPSSSHMSGFASSVPFARLRNKNGTVVLCKYEHYNRSTTSVELVTQKVVRRAVEDFGCKSVNVFTSQPQANSELKEGEMWLKSCTVKMSKNGNIALAGQHVPEEPTILTSGMFGFAFVGRNSNFLHPTPRRSNSWLAIYCLSIGDEFISVSFFATEFETMKQFLQFCSRIIDSASLGNHYGQDTSMMYFNLRHFVPFSLVVPPHVVVTETQLNDPVVVCQGHSGASRQLVCLRCISSIVSAYKDASVFQNELMELIRQLGGKMSVNYCRTIRLPLFKEGLDIVHTHDFTRELSTVPSHEETSVMSRDASVPNKSNEADDDDQVVEVGDFSVGNPLARYAPLILEEETDCDIEAVEKRRTILVRHRGLVFVFQTAATPYCFEPASKFLEEIVNTFTPL